MPVPATLRKTFIATCLLLTYALGIALALELALHFFLKDQYLPPGIDSPNIWQYHPTYGWAGKPDIDAMFRAKSFSIQVQHNHLGFRDKEYSPERNNKKRMLVLGDSFVWCYGVEQQQCFHQILEMNHPDWEIISTGLAGSGTDQQLLILKDLIKDYRPDVVMLVAIQNDFQDNLAKENHFYFKPYYTLEQDELTLHQVPVPPSNMDQLLERWVYGRSYLFGIGNLVRIIVWNQIRISLGMEPIRFEPYRNFNFKQSIKIIQRLVKEMMEVSYNNGARFIVLHGQMLDFLHIALQQVANENKFPLHNLDSAFEGYVHKQYQLPGDAHWNALGHNLVAKDVDRYLTEIKVFDAY